MVRFLGHCGPKVCEILHLLQHKLKALGLWFLVCYADTQLAIQLQQRCIQVVRSNKEALKRLTESNGTPAMDLRHMDVVFK